MRSLIFLRQLFFLGIIPWFCCACSPGAPGSGLTEELAGSENPKKVLQTNPQECVEEYDPEVDYFPIKALPDHAEEFSVEYYNNYKVIRLAATVKEILQAWRGSTGTENDSEEEEDEAETGVVYVLVQCGTPAPAIPEAVVVEIPARTVVTTATPDLPFFVELGLADTVVGHANLKYVNSPEIRHRIERGEVVEVGDFTDIREYRLDLPVILETDPDLIFVTALGEFLPESVPILNQAGISIIQTPSLLEASPLGRAEWIYFNALFFNREAEAIEYLQPIEESYREMVVLTREISSPPKIFAGGVYEGQWWIPGGRSYISWLVADAGGEYLWADEPSSNNIWLSIEEILPKAAEGDMWIYQFQWLRISEIKAHDPRLGNLPMVKMGQVYNPDARLSGNGDGGNDFWEMGIIRPDLVLADLIKIFHPELLPRHRSVFYQRIEND